MKQYMLRIAYDGTAYAGWQVQPHAGSVAGTLLHAYQKIFGAPPAGFVGASRTDAGVHAYDQVARLRTNLTIPPEALLRAWNNCLPHDIMLRSITEVDEQFHPQFGVAYKEYWYHFFMERPLPFVARFGTQLPSYVYDFDIDLFEKTLKLFEGTHNFSSFARVEPGYDPVRTVTEVRVERLVKYRMLRVVVRGEGFLRFQIRRMVGSALMVARGGAIVGYDDIASLLVNPVPTSPAFFKIDAHGLCLRRIVYKKDEK